MEPIHRIVPRQPDVAAVPAVHRQPIGPEEREQKRREREAEQQRQRQRQSGDARRGGSPVEADDDGHLHVDLTA
jgi:hypothetical protein